MRLRDELTLTRIELINNKEELMQMRDNLSSVQKTLSEKEILLQEANDHLAEQIPKISSKSEVLGGIKGQKNGNEITSPKTTSESPYSLFFQYAFIGVIVLLIIYFLWCIFSPLYSSYNKEKNIPNYKIPLNRHYSYGFPTRYAEEPKDRTTSYETLPYMDEATMHASSRAKGHEASPDWPFSMIVTGRSGTGKTNLLANLVLGDKGEYIQKRRKGGSRYIRCDDLIVCGYHPDEPKWAFVRYMYGVISKDPRAPYYENIKFSYISPEKIPSVRAFSPERSTVIIFEDLCVAPESIQNRIIPFFTHGRHRNISSIYVTQRYHHTPIIIRENISHLVVFNGGSSYQDISKIIGRYTEDVKNTSMVVNSYLRKGEFIVFDLNKSDDDPLAVRLRFDTPLDLQKEVELREKRKKG